MGSTYLRSTHTSAATDARGVAVGLKAKEVEELEARLEELESALEAQARQKKRGHYGYTG